MPFECQPVWIQIRPDILLGLIWAQTVCKGYQQMSLAGREFKDIIKIQKSICFLFYLVNNTNTAIL